MRTYAYGISPEVRNAATFSGIGIATLLVSLVVNPALAWTKYHYAEKTDSPSLKYEARDTPICEYQTVVVLTGLGLSKWLGGGGPTRPAALLILP